MHAPAAPADRTATLPGRRWDLFCAVVDNLGDAAIGWRLARQLSLEHGLALRLWIDRPDALETLVPGTEPGSSVDGVRIERLDESDARLAATAPGEVADVVVGMLAGAPPEAYRAAMRARVPRATWVAFEYLSAEPWIATHHGLPSPKPDGLVEHFFFPGFGPATGGLLRERDLVARREAFEADPAARAATLAALGVVPRAGERLASLFCYPDAPVVALLDVFAARPEPWRVLVPRGVAPASAGHPVAVPVPFMPQRDYDALLWSCDLNLVRGEESFVRALWATRPMLWQAYRQDEGAHRPKVRAFVDAWARDAAPSEPALRGVAAAHEAWNAPPAECAAALPGALNALLDAFDELAPACHRWAEANAETPDLATRLVGFVGGGL